MSSQPDTDPSSLANLKEVRCSHFDLDLKADFDQKVLVGEVIHTFETLSDGEINQVVLDARNLTVTSVHLVAGDSRHPLTFTVDETPSPLGTPLRITLAPAYEQNLLEKKEHFTFRLAVAYQTSPESVGIQWLAASQTDGKEYPYLFTQFQPIHCRTAVPCQDSPMHKVTYTAKVQVPAPLTALMSAIRDGEPTRSTENGKEMITYAFSQQVPIPTYLLALVIGKLSSRRVGPRSQVWAEDALIEKAEYEFSGDTDTFLCIAEELISPYEWQIYDLLCLPGSFPYGGMENPCLTFVTPTLLAGDRSLTAVVAHEIAHSWTGNLVTSATWEDFWLNEGFTVYTERNILGRMYGESTRQFEYILGNQALLSALDLFGKDHPFTALVPKLDNDTDPDDAFSSIPYEKGSQFLFYLEGLVGAKEFEKFFRDWIVSHRFKSMRTESFQEFFRSSFGEETYKKIDWNGWLHTPGLPPVDVISTMDDTLAREARDLAQKWVEVDKSADLSASPSVELFNKLTVNQKVHFLEEIVSRKPEGFSSATLAAMGEAYAMGNIVNSEIRMTWLTLCLTSKDMSCFPQVEQFVASQGRQKFVRPMYRLMAKCGPEGLQKAQTLFEEHRSYYHNIASKMIAQDLQKIVSAQNE